jgi:hypothetical protein
MFAPTIDHPRYAILFVEHHLTGTETTPALRQWISNGIKLVRAMDPLGWESRADVEALRRWLDLLADTPATARMARVTPAEATALALDSADFLAETFARSLRAMGDEMLLYARLAHQGETGRRGETMRACVEAELLRRPWLIAVPEDTSEYDPAMY